MILNSIFAFTDLNGTAIYDSLRAGSRIYELSNHLRNVLVTISDKKIGHSTDGSTIDYYNSEVVSAQDYYSFGMLMPSRKYSIANTNYRYGFNGKENDNNIENGAQDYGMRIYDGRLGRFLSVDPITGEYPELSPYEFASNRPIEGIDMDGLEYANYSYNAAGMTRILESEELERKNRTDLDVKRDASARINVIPGVGEAKGLIEAFTGKDMITGEKIGVVDRVLGLFFLSEAKTIKTLKTAEKIKNAEKAAELATKVDRASTAEKAIVKNKNTNDAVSQFILYDVHSEPDKQGKLLKVGKADAERMTASGDPVRMKHSERAARKAGYPDATATIRKKLGKTTTARAKEAEAYEVRTERGQGNDLPLNKEKDRKYKN